MGEELEMEEASEAAPTKKVGKRKLEDQRIEERKRREAEEEAQQRAEEEELRKLAEERKQREDEEYKLWKGNIIIEEEGQKEEETEKQLADIVNYIKKHKVVQLEDLSTVSSMRTQELVDVLRKLEDRDELSGVIDDRGKYVYISPSEMEEVAQFIKRRGRVSIEDIAAQSNKLINLSPLEREDVAIIEVES